MIIQLDLGYVNAYLIEEDGQFVLIDTGGYLFADKANLNNRRSILEEKMKAAGVTEQNLKLLVLTHGDSDHCMNAAYIARTYHVPVAMHKADLCMVQAPDLELLMKTVNYRSFGMKLIGRLIHSVLVKQTIKTIDDFETFTPDIFLEDGDSLESYGFHATIIHIPGHTDGSIGVVTLDGDAVIGDAGPGTPNATDFAAFDRSLEIIGHAGYRMLYMGHRDPEKYEL